MMNGSFESSAFVSHAIKIRYAFCIVLTEINILNSFALFWPEESLSDTYTYTNLNANSNESENLAMLQNDLGSIYISHIAIQYLQMPVLCYLS